MNHWHHIPPEKVPLEGFTALRLEPEDIKSEIEALPAPAAPKPLQPKVVRLKQDLAGPAARANAAAVGIGTRPDQKEMVPAHQAAFRDAVRTLVNDGTYKELVEIHSDMSHNMHGSMGPAGMLRFLAWHRRYILEFERALVAADSTERLRHRLPLQQRRPARQGRHLRQHDRQRPRSTNCHCADRLSQLV